MNKLSVMIILLAGLLSTPVLAGPGDDHEHTHSSGSVSADEAYMKALQKVEELATAGKIDASWSDIHPISVEQKTYDQGPEWVLTFKNDNISEADKQTLYLFYSLDGNYIAANYTGK
jgi:hypothetical protein